MDETNKDELLCRIIEINYMKSKNIDFDNASPSDYIEIFSKDWFNEKNYRKKIEILTEAMTKNISIYETKGYHDLFDEGSY